jgi:predicted transcriptional regulator YheO
MHNKTKKYEMTITNYIPICDGIVLIMKPLVEVVIHDLTSDTICYINGNLSKRKIGDPSLLEIKDFEPDIDKIVYPKLSFDGRLIKSISIPVERKWLICINCDTSIFNQMKNLSEIFLNHDNINKPESLFKNDWQERLHVVIHNFLREKNWNFNDLNTPKNKELIKHLFDIGVFAEKNAANYVAQVLKLGRATIFKYLKELRNL